MYKYVLPIPLIVDLCDKDGFEMRQQTASYVAENLNVTGAERGSSEEQGFGALAEIVVRKNLGMPAINPREHPVEFDLLLPSAIKVDVKCRGGTLPFKENYTGSDGFPREAKHNFFARQVYGGDLETDIYVLTHLETPSNRTLPGTIRQRKWKLYVCGWVSKARVVREGVFLPRGSLTEQGRTWFTYRGQEIEFYNRNLNGLSDLKSLLTIDMEDIDADIARKGDLNLTSVDATRIAYDMHGRGIISSHQVEFVIKKLGVNGTVHPILHPNQYHHLIDWLEDNGQAGTEERKKLQAIMEKVPFEGI